MDLLTYNDKQSNWKKRVLLRKNILKNVHRSMMLQEQLNKLLLTTENFLKKLQFTDVLEKFVSEKANV